MNRDREFAFLLGIGAGVAIGLLCAPRSGAMLRKSIADKANDAAGAAKKQAGDLWNSTSDVLGNGAATVGRTRDALKSAVQAGKEAFHGSNAEQTAEQT